MKEYRIGVMADCFRLGLEEGIRKASRIGAEGVQLYAVGGSLHPGISGRRKAELRRLLDSEGLALMALCGDVGGFDGNADMNHEKVLQTERIMDLAAEMGTGIVTAHIGVVPQDREHPVWKEMQERLGALGAYGGKQGVVFAAETGPEPAAVLLPLLESIRGVGVNYDPANLLMVSGDDPVAGVYTLKDYIVHTHAKDGINLRRAGGNAVGGDGRAPDAPGYIEVPLGRGGVDFPGWLRALVDIGYDGFLTIEREVGDDPEGEILSAMRYLKTVMRTH